MKEPEPFHPSNILCPVDFSELSDLALKYAAAGVTAFGASLTVFHAQRFTLPPYFTSSQIKELKRQRQGEKARAKQFLRLHVKKVLGSAAEALRVKYDLEEAHPVDAILAAAERHKADLIVMGTHGRGGAKRLWLGSVLENVARQAGIPIFAVRQKQHEFIDTSDPKKVPLLQTILAPVNPGGADRASMACAVSLAKQFRSRLITACIRERGDSRGLSELREKVLSLVQQSDAAECEVEVRAGKAAAGEEIVALASQTRADLVILGAKSHHGVHTWFWGDTTEYVLRHAPVPVLVVRDRLSK